MKIRHFRKLQLKAAGSVAGLCICRGRGGGGDYAVSYQNYKLDKHENISMEKESIKVNTLPKVLSSGVLPFQTDACGRPFCHSL